MRSVKTFWCGTLYKWRESCYNNLAVIRTGGSMDRASDSGSEGWGFESLPVCQTNKRDTHPGIPLICLALRAERDSNNLNAARMSAAGDGLTEPNLNFLPQRWEKMQPSPFRCATRTGLLFGKPVFAIFTTKLGKSII